MRRLVSALAALAVAAPAALAAVPSAPAPSGGTAVGVAQREFYITAYRHTVAPGLVRFNVRNFGEDTHNFVVRGPHGYLKAGPDVGSGDSMTLSVKLRRQGTYLLLCTRADHLRRGMKTKLVVRKPARPKR
jgi:plastocyanin